MHVLCLVGLLPDPGSSYLDTIWARKESWRLQSSSIIILVQSTTERSLMLKMSFLVLNESPQMTTDMFSCSYKYAFLCVLH